jgi:NitT/TauT family transport system permease protein
MSTYSKEHIEYLKKRKKEKRIVCFFRLLIIVCFLIAWELLSRFELINTFLSSSPTKVIETIYQLFQDKTLFTHIGVTLYEVFISFSIATILGFIIATILWSNKIIAKVVDPYLTILNSLPKVALGPLIIIWVGASTNSIIFMALLISTFVTIITIYQGFSQTNKSYITLLKSFGATKWQIFIKVVLPSNIPTLISALKINISMSLIGVIMGELLVSKSGLGYLIMYGSQVFNINLVITGVVILGIISYIMYFIIDLLEIYSKKKQGF